MERISWLLSGIMIILAAVLLALPVTADAGGRHSRHRHHGRFWTGFGLGLGTGYLLAPRYYYAPPHYQPVVPYYVAPRCYQQYYSGYWSLVPRSDGGFTTYNYQWVPYSYQTICP